MKRSTAMAATVAGVLLSGMFAGRADAGWFGLGGSSKSSEAAKSPKTDYYDPNLVASGATPSSSTNKKSSGFGSLFGLGKPSSNTQASKKKTVTSTSRSKTTDKSQGSSWWSSWFKPKEPPPPKEVSEWMRLKPVRW